MCKKLFIILNIILFLSGCGYNSKTYSPYLSKTKNIQFLVDQGKINWEKRVNIDEANKSKLFLSMNKNVFKPQLNTSIIAEVEFEDTTCE